MYNRPLCYHKIPIGIEYERTGGIIGAMRKVEQATTVIVRCDIAERDALERAATHEGRKMSPQLRVILVDWLVKNDYLPPEPAVTAPPPKRGRPPARR